MEPMQPEGSERNENMARPPEAAPADMAAAPAPTQTTQATSPNTPNHMMRNGAIFIVVVAVLIGAYIFFNSRESAPEELEKVTVRLGWLHQAQFAGFYVAKEKGFYEEAGLDVELLELDQSVGQVPELESGDVEFSVMESHQALVGVDEGYDVQAVMAVYQLNPHSLAVRADSDIYGPKDFAGKTIGLSGGEGEGDALFRIFVEKFGNADTVTYKNIGFSTIDDFKNNTADIIDLYSTDQPYLAEKRGVPLRVISLDAYGFATYGDVVVATRTFIEANPDMVGRFVAATLRGWEYALVNQDEAIAIVLPYTSGDYADVDYQRHILQQSTPLIRGTQSALGRMDLVSWSTLYESMRSAGALTRDFDVTSIYTNEFIK